MSPIKAGKLVILGPRVLSAEPRVAKGAVASGRPLTYTPSKDGMGLRVWSGEGPPPPLGLYGIAVGDTYVDTISGNVYRLNPGE